MNASEAHEMLRASCRNPQLTAQIVPSPFTLPFDRTIQRLVADGKLGDLVYIEVRHVGSAFADPYGAPLSWRQDINLSGNNVMTLGIFYEALRR